MLLSFQISHVVDAATVQAELDVRADRSLSTDSLVLLQALPTDEDTLAVLALDQLVALALPLSQAAHTLGFTSVPLLVAVALFAVDAVVGSVHECSEGGQDGEVIFVEEEVDLGLFDWSLVDTGP